MTVATTIGGALGTSGAYIKHGAIRTVTGSGGFVTDVFNATVDSYRAKDAELAAKRAELAAMRAERAVVREQQPALPNNPATQNKVDVDTVTAQDTVAQGAAS